MQKKILEENMREGAFAKHLSSNIWLEEPSEDNPYLAKSCHCHGYDLMELMDKCSYEEMLLLMFQGELPTPERKQLLKSLMVALANPGPRHPATRSAMCAGVGKTDPKHILPIALNIMGGDHLGAGEVAKSMQFMHGMPKQDMQNLVKNLISENPRVNQEEDWVIAAGFGSHFGGIDPMAQAIAAKLAGLPGAGKYLRWGMEFSDVLLSHGLGWRIPGVAAAAFLDMKISGLKPWLGIGLFQLISAPGLLAHGLEYHLKPLSAYPFPTDDNYIIESHAKKN
ncbi:MAG: citrate synthase [Magnetococcales bacterium]|nr:citrate synthase [Magnetococcales bacterium]